MGGLGLGAPGASIGGGPGGAGFGTGAILGGGGPGGSVGGLGAKILPPLIPRVRMELSTGRWPGGGAVGGAAIGKSLSALALFSLFLTSWNSFVVVGIVGGFGRSVALLRTTDVGDVPASTFLSCERGVCPGAIPRPGGGRTKFAGRPGGGAGAAAAGNPGGGFIDKGLRLLAPSEAEGGIAEAGGTGGRPGGGPTGGRPGGGPAGGRNGINVIFCAPEEGTEGGIGGGIPGGGVGAVGGGATDLGPPLPSCGGGPAGGGGGPEGGGGGGMRK